jgi:hypothetical protein
MLDNVRHRTPQEPEADRVGALETNGLDRGCRHSPADRRPMGGEYHVAPALENLDLLSHRPGCPVQVRRSDDVEHRLPRGCDAQAQRPEGLNPPPDAGVERQFTAHDE